MKKYLKKSFFLLLILLFAVFVSCSKKPNHSNKYQLELKKSIDIGYPGMILSIEKDDQIWTGSIGLSSVENQIKMKPNDRFHLASVTKIFTAVAVLKLVDEGKLKLSDKAINYLDSGLVGPIPHINEITIGQLLDHSSGIYSFNNDMAYLETLIGERAFDKVKWTNEQLLSLAYGERVEPQGEPGSGNYYADTNCILQGLIIEKISGMPFRQFIKQEILTPLELNNTGFYSDTIDSSNIGLPTTVQGYLKRSKDLDGFITIHPSFKEVSQGLINTTIAVEKIDAAAGMVSTAPDLMTFGIALYKGDLLSRKSLDWLLSIGEGIETETTDTKRQGIVTAHNKSYGVLYTSLGDGGGGINTMLAYHPKSETIVVAFVNIFGNFNEHDFFMDEIIPSVINESKKEPKKSLVE